MTKDRSIDINEFIEYYNNISCSIDNDVYFEQVINTCWNLNNENRNYGKAWRGEF